MTIRKKLLFASFTLLMITFVAGVLGEILLRIFQSSETGVFQSSDGSLESIVYTTDQGTRLKKSMKGVLLGFGSDGKDIIFETNSQGYRNYELASKTKNDFRILTLGDSITMAGTVNDQDTFVRQIEKRLNLKKNKNYQVINAGIGGIDLLTSYYILLETGLSIKPDLVLLGLYLNDAASSYIIQPVLPTPFHYSRILRELYKFGARIWIKLTNHRVKFLDEEKSLSDFSKSSPHYEGNWKQDPAALNQLILNSWDGWGRAWSIEAWKMMEPILKELKNMETKGLFELVVVLFPVKYQVESEYLNDVPQNFMKNISKELNITYYDILPDLRDRFKKNPDRNIYRDDCHPLEYGHHLYGELLEKYLSESILK